MCQSVRAPAAGEVGLGSHENMHIGATRMRFLKVVLRIWRGRKSVGVLEEEVRWRAQPALLAGVKKGDGMFLFFLLVSFR